MAACGFPNQDFFYYGEDTDYAFRLAEQGFKSYIVPKCVVEHAGGGFMAPALLPVSANWRYYYMYRNQLTLVRMYGGRLGPLVIRLRGALPRAERAVLVAEPAAHVEWPASEWMIVTVEWRNTAADLRRVRRVLVEMLPLVHAVRRVVDVECQRHPARPA